MGHRAGVSAGALALVLIGCGADDVADAVVEGPRVLAPPVGLTARVARVPLVVDAPLVQPDAEVHVTIDGQSHPLPAPVLRERTGRTELLAELDVSGLAPGAHELRVVEGAAHRRRRRYGPDGGAHRGPAARRGPGGPGAPVHLRGAAPVDRPGGAAPREGQVR